jgi:hypothetical protein
VSLPVVVASLNKASYAPGEVMVLTVNYGDVDNQAITVTVVATDASGNASAPVTVTANIMDPVSVAVSSVPARVWTLVSDTGVVAVYTAVA